MLYVTERCVFRRSRRGWQLIEVAPGIDIERDILAHMDFRPIDRRRGDDGRAHLPAQVDGPGRGAARPAAVRSPELRRRAQHAVRQLRGHGHPQTWRTSRACAACSRRCAAQIGRKVNVIVNYDGFKLDDAADRDLRRDGRRAARQVLHHGRAATRPAPSCARSWARPCSPARPRRGCSRRVPMRLSSSSARRRPWSRRRPDFPGENQKPNLWTEKKSIGPKASKLEYLRHRTHCRGPISSHLQAWRQANDISSPVSTMPRIASPRPRSRGCRGHHLGCRPRQCAGLPDAAHQADRAFPCRRRTDMIAHEVANRVAIQQG